MRVGFLIYSMGGGGAERTVANLANRFVDCGLDVSLILFESAFMEYELDPRIRHYSCEVRGFYSKIDKTIKRISLIRKALLKERVEVLLAFTVSMVPYALAAGRGKLCKVIGTERANPKNHKKMYQWVIRHLSARCDGYIFQTEGAKNYYPEKAGRRAAVIPNPVRDPGCLWSPAPGLNFCSAGRLHPDKDFDTMLRAFALFYQTHPDSSLTIYGEGEQKGELERLAAELGAEKAVHFHGFIKDLQRRLAGYSAFIFSSKSEGMPNVLLEAMSVGMPCIATDCDFGPGEIISQGVNGILVRPGQRDELCRALVWVAEHAGEREEMARRASEVKEAYSEKKIADMYLDYIIKIMKGRK